MLVIFAYYDDNRFKAACAQRGVYDQHLFCEGNAWRLVLIILRLPMGTKKIEILARESPLTYVENIKTPFIIFSGGRSPYRFVQGEMKSVFQFEIPTTGQWINCCCEPLSSLKRWTDKDN
jgi:hypothetical protein